MDDTDDPAGVLTVQRPRKSSHMLELVETFIKLKGFERVLARLVDDQPMTLPTMRAILTAITQVYDVLSKEQALVVFPPILKAVGARLEALDETVRAPRGEPLPLTTIHSRHKTPSLGPHRLYAT